MKIASFLQSLYSHPKYPSLRQVEWQKNRFFVKSINRFSRRKKSIKNRFFDIFDFPIIPSLVNEIDSIIHYFDMFHLNMPSYGHLQIPNLDFWNISLHCNLLIILFFIFWLISLYTSNIDLCWKWAFNKPFVKSLICNLRLPL